MPKEGNTVAADRIRRGQVVCAQGRKGAGIFINTDKVRVHMMDGHFDQPNSFSVFFYELALAGRLDLRLSNRPFGGGRAIN